MRSAKLTAVLATGGRSGKTLTVSLRTRIRRRALPTDAEAPPSRRRRTRTDDRCSDEDGGASSQVCAAHG